MHCNDAAALPHRNLPARMTEKELKKDIMLIPIAMQVPSKSIAFLRPNRSALMPPIKAPVIEPMTNMLTAKKCNMLMGKINHKRLLFLQSQTDFGATLYTTVT